MALYGRRAGTKGLREMLNELLHRLQTRGITTQRDFQGTIGAALCWGKRLANDRYEQTTSRAELELKDLEQCGRLHNLGWASHLWHAFV